MGDTRPAELSAVPFSRPTKDAVGKVDLAPLAEQLMAIAEQLRSGMTAENPILDQGKESRSFGGVTSIGSAKSSGSRQAYAAMARELYAIRRHRPAIFGNAELFGEPAWDILLDLYVAHAEDKPVSVSSACIGSDSPATTGLRWLGILAQEGLVVREHDPDDQLVRLSDEGLASMDAYFAHVTEQA